MEEKMIPELNEISLEDLEAISGGAGDDNVSHIKFINRTPGNFDRTLLSVPRGSTASVTEISNNGRCTLTIGSEVVHCNFSMEIFKDKSKVRFNYSYLNGQNTLFSVAYFDMNTSIQLNSNAGFILVTL